MISKLLKLLEIIFSLLIFASRAMPTYESLSVCHGGALNLTCQTNETYIKWTIMSPTAVVGTQDRYIYDSGVNTATPFSINTTTFTFFRISTSPLMSTVFIVNITTAMNSTTISCSNGETNLKMPTIINIIGNNGVNQGPSAIIIDEMFHQENVTVTIEWEQQNGYIYDYEVTSVPDASAIFEINQSKINNVQFTVLYNVQYNVSVVARNCQETRTNITKLYYGKCQRLLNIMTDQSLTVNVSQDYDDLLLEGSNITFGCNDSIGLTLTLIGPNTIQCMNGQWTPDPMETQCKASCKIPQANNFSSNYVYTLEDSLLRFRCKEGLGLTNEFSAVCHKNGSWIPNLHDDQNCMIVNHTELESDMITVIVVTALVAIGIIAGTVLAFTLITCLLKRSGVSLCKQRKSSSLNMSGVQEDVQYHHINRQVELQPLKIQPVAYADIGALSIKQPRISTAPFSDNMVQYATLQPYEPSTHFCDMPVEYNTADETLNLDSMLIQIQIEVTNKWYEFGESIGINKEVLEKWMQYPPEQNIIEVCDNWLRNHLGKPTWREVAEALRQINCQQLAFEIENVYETGKLPKEIHDVPQPLCDGSNPVVDESEDIHSPPPIPPRSY